MSYNADAQLKEKHPRNVRGPWVYLVLMTLWGCKKICLKIYGLDYFNFFIILVGPKKKMLVYYYLNINLNLFAL